MLLVVSRVLGGHLTLFLCSPLLVSNSASSDDLFKALEVVVVVVFCFCFCFCCLGLILPDLGTANYL